MAGGVDQIEVVRLAILGGVLQRGGLRLDGDATLFLDVHRVQHARFHFTGGQPLTALDQLVGQRRLTVVDVRDDGKISDVLHQQSQK